MPWYLFHWFRLTLQGYNVIPYVSSLLATSRILRSTSHGSSPLSNKLRKKFLLSSTFSKQHNYVQRWLWQFLYKSSIDKQNRLAFDIVKLSAVIQSKIDLSRLFERRRALSRGQQVFQLSLLNWQLIGMTSDWAKVFIATLSFLQRSKNRYPDTFGFWTRSS